MKNETASAFSSRTDFGKVSNWGTSQYVIVVCVVLSTIVIAVILLLFYCYITRLRRDLSGTVSRASENPPENLPMVDIQPQEERRPSPRLRPIAVADRCSPVSLSSPLNDEEKRKSDGFHRPIMSPIPIQVISNF